MIFDRRNFDASPKEIAWRDNQEPELAETPEPSKPPTETLHRASALMSEFLKLAYRKLNLPMEGHDIGTMRYIDLPEDVLQDLVRTAPQPRE